MKRSKLLAIIIILAIISQVLIIPSMHVSAASVKLNKKAASLNVGDVIQLKLLNSKGATTWKSNNTKIATVNKNGKVKAIKEGNVKITATNNKKSYVCTIKIQKNIENPPSVEANIFTTDEMDSKTSFVLLTVKNNGDKVLTLNFDGYVLNEGYPSLSSSVNLFDSDDSNMDLIESVKIKSGKTASVFYRNEDFNKFWIDGDTEFIFNFTYDGVKFTGYSDTSSMYFYEQGHIE